MKLKKKEAKKMELEKRVEWWLKDTSKWLDISNLGLKEWPDILKGKENLIIHFDKSHQHTLTYSK